MPEKALIAMSGGVDSSVAVYLMKESGYDCIGCMMRLYDNDEYSAAESKTCCSLDDAEDARSVAIKLGIPFYVFNFTGEFRRTVIDSFINSYMQGKTPNPCIECNRHLKFAKLFERAKELGCDYIVTGHYARIVKSGDKFYLKKGVDNSKDQSYVLYSLTQEQLAHIKLPIGEMSKSDVREKARLIGLINSEKPDSQDICFVPDGDYAKMIERYSGIISEEGDFVDTDGKVIGRHKGIIHYTVGQRKGLGTAFGEPKYVCRIDPENNTVTLGDNSDLFTRVVKIKDINWISGDAPPNEFRCTAKIRYNHREQPALVTPSGSTATLLFDEPQRAVTPGQAAVMYDGDFVIGGGVII